MELIDIDNYDEDDISFTKWRNVNGGGYSLTFDILYHLLINDQKMRSNYLGIVEEPETPKEELLTNLMNEILPYCSFMVNEYKLSKEETKERVKMEKLARKTGETNRRNIEKLIKQRISNMWEIDEKTEIDIKYYNTLTSLDTINRELKNINKEFKQIEKETTKNREIFNELLGLKELLKEHKLEEDPQINERLDYLKSSDYIREKFDKLKPQIQKIQLLTPFIEKINDINTTIMNLNEYIPMDDAILNKETENEQYRKFNLDYRENNPLQLQTGNYKTQKILENVPDLLDFL